MRSRAKGFTLIELMVVVVIIAILTAIAYPAYIDHVRKTRFAQAKEGAQEVATALERWVSQRAVYPDSLAAASITNLPYQDDLLSYAYSALPKDATSTDKTTYQLVVTEKVNRFGIWVAINNAGMSGTHCGCDGKICKTTDNPTFSSTLTACSDPSRAF